MKYILLISLLATVSLESAFAERKVKKNIQNQMELEQELDDLHLRSQVATGIQMAQNTSVKKTSVIMNEPVKMSDPVKSDAPLSLESESSKEVSLNGTKEKMDIKKDTASEVKPSSPGTTLKAKIEAPSQKGVLRRITPYGTGVSASLEGDDVYQIQRKTRFGGGLSVELGQKNFVFETGLFYYQLGAQYKNTDNDTISTWEFNYVTMPLLGKFYFSTDLKSSIFLQGGAYVSALTSSSYSYRYTGTLIRQVIINPANDYDYGAMVGLGGKINLTDRISLMVEANYLRGFAPVIKSYDVFNSALMVGAGVGIEL